MLSRRRCSDQETVCSGAGAFSYFSQLSAAWHQVSLKIDQSTVLILSPSSANFLPHKMLDEHTPPSTRRSISLPVRKTKLKQPISCKSRGRLQPTRRDESSF